MIVLIVLILLVVIILLSCIRIVPQASAYVIERLGIYHATWVAGLHLKVPLIDRVARKVLLKEQVADFAPQPVITKDNVTMMIDSIIYFRVVNPQLYAYGVENPIMAMENLTATTLRNIIGDMELDEILSSREKINVSLRDILDENTDKWGVKIEAVEIREVDPATKVKDSMEEQTSAERRRRAAILAAEILALGDKAISDKLDAYREAQAEKIRNTVI